MSVGRSADFHELQDHCRSELLRDIGFRLESSLERSLVYLDLLIQKSSNLGEYTSLATANFQEGSSTELVRTAQTTFRDPEPKSSSLAMDRLLFELEQLSTFVRELQQTTSISKNRTRMTLFTMALGYITSVRLHSNALTKMFAGTFPSGILLGSAASGLIWHLLRLETRYMRLQQVQAAIELFFAGLGCENANSVDTMKLLRRDLRDFHL